MLTMLVEMETFSMSCGLVGTMSGGTGSCLSPSFCPSPGRLFFFSFDDGGWRRDCENPGMHIPVTSNTERATAKKGYNRLNFIVFDAGEMPAASVLRVSVGLMHSP